MDKDLVSNIFFSDNERYADIINGIGCEGMPFVRGEDLQKKLITPWHSELCVMMRESMSVRQRK